MSSGIKDGIEIAESEKILSELDFKKRPRLYRTCKNPVPFDKLVRKTIETFAEIDKHIAEIDHDNKNSHS